MVCNICKWRGRSFVKFKKCDSFCPNCKSQSRTRLLSHLLNSNSQYYEKILHVSPNLPEYTLITQTLNPIIYDKIDRNALPYENKIINLENPFELNQKYNLIIVMSVMQFIKDDINAMSRLIKHLAPNGKLLINVPISGNITQEIENINDKSELRFCGLDYLNKFNRLNINYKIYTANSLSISAKEMETYGLCKGDHIFEVYERK